MTSKYFWLAIAGHVLILVIGSLMFLAEKTQGEKPVTVFVQHSLSSMPSMQERVREGRHLGIKENRTPPPLTPPPAKSARGGELLRNTAPLLDLLHTAISMQQIYPESALQLKQTGTVTVQFLLHPNGTIENIQLQHGSGIASLDAAAVAAVMAASPVSGVNGYISSAQMMTVDVVYKLSI